MTVLYPFTLHLRLFELRDRFSDNKLSHTVCPELFGHWRFSETSDPIVEIPKGEHSYMQKYTFDPFPNLKAIKAADDCKKGQKQFFGLNFSTVGPILMKFWHKAFLRSPLHDTKNYA